MFKQFAGQKAVFVNQDAGMFVAFPITLDTNVHTLETEVRNGKTYVKAGSVVKEGTSVKGILAEEYDISAGKVVARVVLEGYAWASRLTASALSAISALPKIVVMPYKYIELRVKSIDDTNHTITLEIISGAKFGTVTSSDLTVTVTDNATLTYTTQAGGKELLIASDKATTVKITAFAVEAFLGASTGTVLKGLPIEQDI